LSEVVPIGNAAMADRTFIEWDKDDLDTLGLLKVDVLGLGMLTCIRKAFSLIEHHYGRRLSLGTVPRDDARVYDMLCRADSIGVFQVESRAQMATLPRLRPRNFYDLVVEVALIRPGPIQGGSVHPYIRRRNGQEEVTYDHPVMEKSLAKTLGIPLFQEQLMQLAVDVAGFDAGEADQLRRAMGAKRSKGKMEKLKARLYDGMRERHGITGPVADRIYERLLAFANFGFAESHALSFAALVFYSAWLKLHHPAAFCAALLRAQPMGFYSPQSLVADARRHGVTVRRPDVNASNAYADLDTRDGKPAVRLGLDEVRSIGDELAGKIVANRPKGGYRSLDQLTRTVTLTAQQAEALATAGALDSIAGGQRRNALWAAGAAAGERAGTLDLPEPEAPALLVRGVVERAGGAVSIVADRIARVNLIAATPSRDFR
jgi:error-prone DNA polymerase